VIVVRFGGGSAEAPGERVEEGLLAGRVTEAAERAGVGTEGKRDQDPLRVEGLFGP
jgi:hypothetical protein